MSLVDSLFVLILEFSLVSCVLLGSGAVAVRFLGQPLERIRLIQVTLSLVFFIAVVGRLGWLPSTDFAWLPGDSKLNGAYFELVPSDTQPAASTSPLESAKTNEIAERDNLVRSSTSEERSGGASSFLPQRDATSVVETDSNSISFWNQFQMFVVFGFSAITVAQAIYFLFGYLATHRLVASASPLQLSEAHSRVIDEFQSKTADHRIRLAVSKKISVPIASGILRPSIVLPQKLFVGPVDRLRLRHSLDHEWKHIEQGDLITWHLASLAQIVLWHQPFYWLLRRELRVSQDQIADHFATRMTNEQVEYASTLLEFSRQSTCLFGALTMAGTKSNLYRRVEMLLNNKFNVSGKSRKRIVVGFAGSLASIGVLLSSIHLTYAADSPADSAKQEKNAASEIVIDAKPAEHFGFVVDALNDKPVPHATVIVTRMRSDTWEEIEVTKSQTDETGRFTFVIPVEQLQQKYLYIMFDLRHETYAPRHCGSYSYAMLQKNKKLGAAPWFKKLTMVPGERITGRFVDKQGNPVVGAAVRVRSQNEEVGGFSGQSHISKVTDENGEFEALVTAKGTASVSVIPKQHCMKHLDLGKNRGKLGEIILADGVSVSGVVLDALGKPMDGLWVNWREANPIGSASYEARRSSKTNPEGRFSTRPLKPGKYTVAVETRATGALEKRKYANFGDVPPPAVFLNQTIEVTAASKEKPFVLQAVPHIYISGQCYNPQGEFTSCHFPSLIGKINGQFMEFNSTKGDRVGQFRILAPHGIKNSDLRFITNEHTGLTVQFDGEEPTPQTDYRFEILEEDISNIKVVRYVAPIVQVKLVDESGNSTTNAIVHAVYVEDAKEKTMMRSMVSSSHFEKQGNGVFRSSQLVPNVPFRVIVRSEGFETAEKTMSMEEGATTTITMELKTQKSSPSGAAEAE